MTTEIAIYLLGLAACIAVVVQLVKEGIRLVLPGWSGRPVRLLLRSLAVLLGACAAYALHIGPSAAVDVLGGILAGALSEVVYRWLVKELLPAGFAGLVAAVKGGQR